MLPGSPLPRKISPTLSQAYSRNTLRVTWFPCISGPRVLSLRVKWFPKAWLGQTRFREFLGVGKRDSLYRHPSLKEKPEEPPKLSKATAGP